MLAKTNACRPACAVSLDPAGVDATTDEDIAKQAAIDEAEAMQDAVNFRRAFHAHDATDPI